MKYTNPIIKGFHPDPSICRVGEDYYLVTSSFEYFPGIPIYHSCDLVNWEQIGNCIERADQIPFGDTQSSGGIWAPTIRYNDGTFYVTATFDGKGNFIISSDDPAHGWSDAVWTDFSGIDPSMFFENGKMYYCANDAGERNHKYGFEGISLVQMDPDTGEVIGEIKRIWRGTGGGWLEAPHIYHIGEYYYVIAAEGGTGGGHHETTGRSKNIWGPYESYNGNPILTNRNDCSKQVSCSGHADLTDDGNGNWWAVHLGVRPVEGMSALGRETFLMPVIWENGWPIIGEKKMSQIEVEAPLWKEQKIISKQVFDFNDTDMEPQWLFRRIPHTENYLRTGEKLILKPSEVKLSDSVDSPTFMALRPLDLTCTAEVEFEFDTKQDGDAAGITVYLNERFYYRLYKKREGNKDYMIFERQVDDIDIVEYREEIKTGVLKMKIKADGNKYYLYYSLSDEGYIDAGNGSVKFLSTNIAGKCFTGALMGVFTECDAPTDAKMRIHRYGMELRKGG